MPDFKLSQGVVSNPASLPLSGNELLFGSQDNGEGFSTIVFTVAALLAGTASIAQLDALAQSIAMALQGKANTQHSHTIAQVDGLASALSGKANAQHSHTMDQIQGLADALAARLSTSGGTVNGSVMLNGVLYYGTGTNGVAIYQEGSGVTIRTGSSAAGYRYFQLLSNGNLAVPNGSIATAGGYDYGSARALKNRHGDIAYTLDDLDRIPMYRGRYKDEYNDDARDRLFYDAEGFFEIVPEAVDMAAIEFNGGRVPGVKMDQAVPMNTHFLQLLHAKVKDQQQQIDELKAMVAKLTGKG